MAGNCLSESYEDHLQKNDFFENKLYLENKNCCDANSCDKLSIEYQNLMHKCRDVFGKQHEINDKGKIVSSDTICDGIEEKRNQLSKLAASYKNPSSIKSNNINIIRNRSRGGKKRITKNKRNQNKNKRNKKKSKRR
jgi:hypothetical protein